MNRTIDPNTLPVVSHHVEDALVMPLRSMSKTEIDERAEFWLNDQLEVYDSASLWCFIKQMELAADALKAKLKTAAFDSIAKELGGSMKGEILGHDVSLSLPKRWVYSESLSAMVEQQKRDLKAAQATEQANGSAYQIPDEPRITVKIREG